MKAACGIVAAFYAAAFCQAATLVRHPYLQRLGSDRVTIVWATAENGSGAVEYSTDRSYARAVPAVTQRLGTTATGLNAAYFQHQADLTGLTAGTEYFYRVVVDGEELAPGDDLRFRTASSGPFSFLVFGDSGAGSPEQLQLARRMQQERPALVLHTGDLAYPNATFEELQKYYFDYYQNLMKRVPFFPSLGNHDYGTSLAAPYLAVHSLPSEGVPASDRGRYYSFDWGNTHFISLDVNFSLSNAVNGTGQMLQWLENDLQRTRQFWRVAYFHQPAYPSSVHEQDSTSELVRARVAPILDRHEVPLVFSGHEHNYQQSHPIRNGQVTDAGAGTVHIITGGGGGPLYPVTPNPWVAYAEIAHHYVRAEVEGPRMTLRAIRIDGQEIDRLTLAPPPRLWEDAAVNAATFTTSLTPGALVTIFGRHLGAGERQAASLPLPTEVSGTFITLNGRRLPLLYISSTQINAQLLFDMQGPVTLRVFTPNGSAETTVMITEAAPAIFSVDTEMGRYPAILHADGTLVSPAFPAEPGEHVSVFLTGLGQVNGPIAAGQAAPFSPPLAARAPIEARFGNTSVTPSFAGLAPGFAGLYQVNVQVPQGLASGMHSLSIRAGGIGSTVTVPIR